MDLRPHLLAPCALHPYDITCSRRQFPCQYEVAPTTECVWLKDLHAPSSSSPPELGKLTEQLQEMERAHTEERGRWTEEAAAKMADKLRVSWPVCMRACVCVHACMHACMCVCVCVCLKMVVIKFF